MIFADTALINGKIYSVDKNGKKTDGDKGWAHIKDGNRERSAELYICGHRGDRLSWQYHPSRAV